MCWNARCAQGDGAGDDAEQCRVGGQAWLATEGERDGHRDRSSSEQEEQRGARGFRESASRKGRAEQPQAAQPARRGVCQERRARRCEDRVGRQIEEPQGASVCSGLRPPPVAGKARSSARHRAIFALPGYASAVLGSLLLASLLAGAPAPPPSARSLVPGSERGNALPLFALDSPDLVAALGPLRAEVGAWAEYLVRSPGGTARMRFSILPPKVEGDRHWLEVAVFGDVGLPFAVRVLLKPGPVVPANVERAIVYVTGQAPLEIPLQDLQDRLRADDPKPSGARTTRGAQRTIATEAGRFKAMEVRITARGQKTRVWRSPEVPLWGLVRAQGPRETIELVRFSHEGAQSAIPEPGQGKGNESTNK